MNRFLIVAVGRNCPELAARCLESIGAQTERWELAVVDDASDAEHDMGWVFSVNNAWDWAIVNTERKYALANQVTAWRTLEPNDDDVIVFVDLDDRLARPDALSIVRSYYEQGALLTYGSYRPVPANHPNAASCRPAQPYPPHVVAARAYRQERPWFNHLRTVSWSVLKHLSEEDLRNDAGEYWRANTDRAVMIPCLEMVGDRYAVIPEVLYEYTCDSEDAVWKTMNRVLVDECAQLRRRPRREML